MVPSWYLRGIPMGWKETTESRHAELLAELKEIRQSITPHYTV